MKEEVILVDSHDNEMGVSEKIEAHQKGLLHRAFSVFVFRKKNEKIEVLLQRRQKNKYHSGGLWTNTCCGHPRSNENIIEAASRRLFEEMGIYVELREANVFTYLAALDHGLSEHEVDHVLVGEFFEQPINVNPKEVVDYCWETMDSISKDLENHPEKYTAWFGQAWHSFKTYFL